MNGEIAFEPALRERVALLEGLETAVVDRIIETRLTLASGGHALVRTMRTKRRLDGTRVRRLRTSSPAASPPCSASRKTAPTGCSRRTAASLASSPTRILGRAAKAEALFRHRRPPRPDAGYAIAVGDGANDLDMIRLAGTGVAMHASRLWRREARSASTMAT